MIELASPLSGWLTPVDDVPDPVFSGRMLGDGVAIDPVEGVLASPGAGRIVSVHPSGHAITVELDAGPVVLLHLGLDTVALGGEGFAPQVRDGERVSAGTPLIHFDLFALARKVRSLVTPVIVTNGEEYRIVAPHSEGPISFGEPLLTLERRSAHTSPNNPEPVGPIAERSLRLPLAHGLHARPAARLSALAGEFDAILEVSTEDGRSASLRSAVGILALSLTHGTKVTLRARGAQAEEALTAASDLIESGMGELLAFSAAEESVPQVTEPLVLPRQLGGVTAVPGVAMGPAFRLSARRTALLGPGMGPDAEASALVQALSDVREGLIARTKADGPLAAIAGAHVALIGDPELLAAAQEQIAAGHNAGYAWSAAIERFAAPLRASPDKRFAERVDDLADLEQAVLTALAGEVDTADTPPPGSVLVGEDILPSQLMALADAGLAGVASAAGGTTAHVAIIAAGLGLPMLCGLGPEIGLIEPGTPLLLRDGALTISPSADELSAARKAAEADARLQIEADLHRMETAVTRDGQQIEVFANLASAEDAVRAVAAGAEGCGLLRTEFLFLGRTSPPTFDEQRLACQSIADALGPRPLIVRTLDIGADKPVPWLAQPQEENPALGLRGIRLQLANPALLQCQLRALVAVEAPGGLRIMLPMVSDVLEVSAARQALEIICKDAGKPMPELGIMIETPAAALIADALAAEADFFSIGSNDLAQYTLARDRTAASVAVGLDALHPAVLRLVDMTASAARRNGCWTGLCGGLATDPVAIPLLVGLGLDELSTPAAAVAATKQIIRRLDRSHCSDLAQEALRLASAAEVRALSARMLEDAL